MDVTDTECLLCPEFFAGKFEVWALGGINNSAAKAITTLSSQASQTMIKLSYLIEVVKEFPSQHLTSADRQTS